MLASKGHGNRIFFRGCFTSEFRKFNSSSESTSCPCHVLTWNKMWMVVNTWCRRFIVAIQGEFYEWGLGNERECVTTLWWKVWGVEKPLVRYSSGKAPMDDLRQVNGFVAVPWTIFIAFLMCLFPVFCALMSHRRAGRSPAVRAVATGPYGVLFSYTLNFKFNSHKSAFKKADCGQLRLCYTQRKVLVQTVFCQQVYICPISTLPGGVDVLKFRYITHS